LHTVDRCETVYGEAVTARAMLEGWARGCDMASLQASPAGYPVYIRLGFKDVAYYKTYARPATASGAA
jgi:hypothetical protein